MRACSPARWLVALAMASVPTPAAASDGVFVAGSDMSFARYISAGTMLNNGSVVLFGPSYDGDEYRQTGRAFSETGLIPGPRFGARAFALADGGALVVGGSPNDARTVRYTASSREWSWGPSLSVSRMAAEAARLPDGRIWVAGGYGAGGTAMASSELYDPAIGTFALARAMPRARQGGVAEVLLDGRVLIAGGANATGYGDPCSLVYSPTTDSFEDGPCFVAAPQGLYAPASARLADGRILLTGGWILTGASTQRVASDAEIYDPSANRWTPYAVAARAEHSVTALSGGTVLVAGGRDDWGVPIAQSELFDPNANEFRNGPSLAVARFGHAAFALPGNRALLAGGQTGDGAWSASTELYVGDRVFGSGFE